MIDPLFVTHTCTKFCCNYHFSSDTCENITVEGPEISVTKPLVVVPMMCHNYLIVPGRYLEWKRMISVGFVICEAGIFFFFFFLIRAGILPERYDRITNMFNPFSAGTAFMLMQTGWIQASRRVTRRLA